LRYDAAGLGWFPTGDVATIDPDGFMQITDRTKDVIKSGGEWIGSIDLENIAMGHPAVAMAACIAAPHPKWDERPLLVVVKEARPRRDARELLEFYDRQGREMVGARRRGLRRLDPAGRDRQDAEEQAARGVPRPCPADGLTAAPKRGGQGAAPAVRRSAPAFRPAPSRTVPRHGG
jgi:acyl-CoA synthetase (AMP-forming)/AMP-acid ligase II